MLARVTYGLVALALATLIAGFFTSESNVLLYISIGLSLAAIVLVLVGAARRAREVPAADLAAEAFGDEEEYEYVDEEEGEEIPEDVLSAFDEFDEDEEEFEDEEEEFEEELEPDEEFEEEEFEEEFEEEEDEPEPAPRRRAAATKTKSKSRSRPKVLVLEGRDRFHSSDCRFVRDKDDDELEEITKATAKRRGYEPCSVCSPD